MKSRYPIALRYNPHFQSGKKLTKTYDYHGAISEFLKLAKDQRWKIYATLEIANINITLKKYQDALNIYNQCLHECQSQSELDVVHLEMARYYYLIAKKTNSTEDIDNIYNHLAAIKDQDQSYVKLEWAQYYASVEDYAKAKSIFDKCSDEDLSDSFFMQKLYIICLQKLNLHKEMHDLAYKFYQHADKSIGSERTILEHKAFFLLSAGLFDKADVAYEHFFNKYPHSWISYITYARALGDRKDQDLTEKRIQLLKKVIHNDASEKDKPTSIEFAKACNTLAIVYRDELGDVKTAHKYLQMGFDADNKNAALDATKAKGFDFKSKREQYYQRASAKDHGRTESRYGTLTRDNHPHFDDTDNNHNNIIVGDDDVGDKKKTPKKKKIKQPTVQKTETVFEIEEDFKPVEKIKKQRKNQEATPVSQEEPAAIGDANPTTIEPVVSEALSELSITEITLPLTSLQTKIIPDENRQSKPAANPVNQCSRLGLFAIPITIVGVGLAAAAMFYKNEM